ncbi:hypothetical protein D9756_001050 [Leucocoprinus leucothites]|uniref:NOL9 N-terminal domain-containing protein n=1 Tax=Leucocoprinus leucothites TaxID=201217 RepID=A0A8H5LNB5_9AGAR|nr:hypothetical protein D9756_001050 [Leucoagaricus leucothites]
MGNSIFIFVYFLIECPSPNFAPQPCTQLPLHVSIPTPGKCFNLISQRLLMISAVAARKAAQAAQQQQGQETSRPLPSVQAPQSPKRKSSSQRSEPPSKKQKRNVRQPTKPSVKSTPLPDVSQTQNDVIIIDSDNDEPESNARILSEESDVEILFAPQHRLEGRAWSPSTPMYDSSDEDAAIDTSGLIDMPSRVPPLRESSSGVILSTFSPLPGQNIFFLSMDDVRRLGPGFQEETKGTLVTLEEGDRMYLLGTCRLMVLRGSIAVNGTVLHPSSTRHNIFAPRSSPLPIIEYHGGDTKAVIDATCLPHSLESLFATKSTLVLLQELRTNVEGLGLVCRTFEGGYEPSGRIDGSVSAHSRSMVFT